MHSVLLYLFDEIHLKAFTVLATALWNIHASIETFDYFDDEEDRNDMFINGVIIWNICFILET